MECTHCGVIGVKVETCEGYKGPHLCPNDYKMNLKIKGRV
jgi:hypothetical protein